MAHFARALQHCGKIAGVAGTSVATATFCDAAINKEMRKAREDATLARELLQPEKGEEARLDGAARQTAARILRTWLPMMFGAAELPSLCEAYGVPPPPALPRVSIEVDTRAYLDRALPAAAATL